MIPHTNHAKQYKNAWFRCKKKLANLGMHVQYEKTNREGIKKCQSCTMHKKNLKKII